MPSLAEVARARAEQERRRRARQRLADLWRPNPDPPGGVNPQRLALETPAQVIGYGGQAGGGKTDLLLGLAGVHHQRALIMRRVSPNLDGIIDRSRSIYGRALTYNEVSRTWRGPGGRIIRFRSCQYERDQENFRGTPYDFYGFDEVTEFTETQVRFIMSWNRTTTPGQRCRVVMTFNPPTDADGEWIIQFFAPWLDPEHARPARSGEERWFATLDGQEQEVDSGQPFIHAGETINPISRTFIRARLDDNPYLRDDPAYKAVLDSLPEPLRSQLKHGEFTTGASDDPWRVIPASWVQAAQRRWVSRPQPAGSPDVVGIDVARGGANRTALAQRWGHDYIAIMSVPGSVTPDGPAVVNLARQAIAGQPGRVAIDIIGVGSSAYDHARPVYDQVYGVNVAGSATGNYRDRSGKLSMRNLRSELYWRLRESLDPAHGATLALPPGREILADLCAARYRILAGGVVAVESKQEIIDRLGRSPDVGDAILLTCYQPPTRKQARAW